MKIIKKSFLGILFLVIGFNGLFSFTVRAGDAITDELLQENKDEGLSYLCAFADYWDIKEEKRIRGEKGLNWDCTFPQQWQEIQNKQDQTNYFFSKMNGLVIKNQKKEKLAKQKYTNSKLEQKLALKNFKKQNDIITKPLIANFKNIDELDLLATRIYMQDPVNKRQDIYAKFVSEIDKIDVGKLGMYLIPVYHYSTDEWVKTKVVEALEFWLEYCQLSVEPKMKLNKNGENRYEDSRVVFQNRYLFNEIEKEFKAACVILEKFKDVGYKSTKQSDPFKDIEEARAHLRSALSIIKSITVEKTWIGYDNKHADKYALEKKFKEIKNDSEFLLKHIEEEDYSMNHIIGDFHEKLDLKKHDFNNELCDDLDKSIKKNFSVRDEAKKLSKNYITWYENYYKHDTDNESEEDDDNEMVLKNKNRSLIDSIYGSSDYVEKGNSVKKINLNITENHFNSEGDSADNN